MKLKCVEELWREGGGGISIIYNELIYDEVFTPSYKVSANICIMLGWNKIGNNN